MDQNFRKKLKSFPVIGTIGRKLSGWFRTERGHLNWWWWYFRDRKALWPNRALKNTAAGKRCFILATGPSINKMNLKQLKGELCVSVSNFFLHPDFAIIKPEYHIFPGAHSPITDEQYKLWFEDAGKKMPAGQKVFVALTDKPIIDKYKLFQKQQVFYYFTTMRRGPVRKIELTRQLPAIQTSPHIAMFIALYLGVKEINLLGVDHDWILHIGDTRHFYDEKESILTRQGYNEWHSPLEVTLKSYLNLWQVYRSIKQYADGRGVKIYNATPGSLLDVFPRRNISTAP
ncbi:hypothetical protein KGQ31_00915 [Patescibacteria group bacterium]|nr:hypothetical protein [Patescibacteria group bacterium]